MTRIPFHLTFSKSSCAAGLLCAVLSALPVFAADAPVLRDKSFEVGGFVGSSYGLDNFRVMGGVNATYALTKRVLPYVEFSYFPGIQRQLTGIAGGTAGSNFVVPYSVRASDFHGGIHYRFIIAEKPIVPYAVFGVGSIITYNQNTQATIQTVNGPLVIPITIAGSTNPAINFGGGIRYYINQRYGVRVEAKVYKPFGAFDSYFGKVEAGFFIQLR